MLSMMLMLLKSALGICFFRLTIPISFFDATFASAPQPFPLSICQSRAFLPRTPPPELLLHVSPDWSPVSCGFWSTKTRVGPPLSCVGIGSFTDSFTNNLSTCIFISGFQERTSF